MPARPGSDGRLPARPTQPGAEGRLPARPTQPGAEGRLPAVPTQPGIDGRLPARPDRLDRSQADGGGGSGLGGLLQGLQQNFAIRAKDVQIGSLEAGVGKYGASLSGIEMKDLLARPGQGWMNIRGVRADSGDLGPIHTQGAHLGGFTADLASGRFSPRDLGIDSLRAGPFKAEGLGFTPPDFGVLELFGWQLRKEVIRP